RAAVGDRDPRSLRHRYRAGSAGRHVHGHARTTACEDFFTATPVDEGISALEPDDAAPRARVGHQERVDLLLWHRMMIWALADVDHEHIRVEFCEYFRSRTETISDHDVGLCEQATRAHGHEVDRARPAADEIDPARGALAAPPQRNASRHQPR